MPVTDNIASVVNKMTATLPAQFMALLVVNTMFVSGLLYFVHSTATVRAEIDTQRMLHIEKILLACVDRAHER